MSDEVIILSKIGTVHYDHAAIMRHRHLVTALTTLNQWAVENSEQTIIGTANMRTEVEIYGWTGSIGRHWDNTGNIYFMPVYIEGRHSVFAELGCEVDQLELEVGGVYQLLDFATHWTEGDGVVVALFIGAFHQARPHDEILNIMKVSSESFLNLKNHKAPRINTEFGIMPDERFVLIDGKYKVFHESELQPLGLDPLDCEQCGLCDKAASYLDKKAPYFLDENRCMNCSKNAYVQKGWQALKDRGLV